MFILRVFVSAAVLAVCAAGIQIQPAAAASTEADAISSFAAKQLSKPYRLGANGMQKFDCSGLVYRAYFETGLLGRISGQQRRANGYYNWFKDQGLLTNNPRKGDLVVWAYKGHKVSHIGIFTGWNNKGQPMAISALVNPYGVTQHRVHGISIPLKAYLRVNLNR